MATTRPYEELLEKLRSQVRFVERSCEDFDSGHFDEGVRLAVTIRVLVHDTGSSASLLGQLGVKHALRYEDTSMNREVITPDGRRIIVQGHLGLVVAEFSRPDGGSKARFVPPLDCADGPMRNNPPGLFDEWWQRPFLTPTQGLELSRRQPVLDVAHKEGGAHVDASTTTYRAFEAGRASILGSPGRAASTLTESPWQQCARSHTGAHDVDATAPELP